MATTHKIKTPKASYTPAEIKGLVDKYSAVNKQFAASDTAASRSPQTLALGRQQASLLSQLSDPRARAAKKAGYLSTDSNGLYTYNATPAGLTQTLATGSQGKSTTATAAAKPSLVAPPAPGYSRQPGTPSGATPLALESNQAAPGIRGTMGPIVTTSAPSGQTPVVSGTLPSTIQNGQPGEISGGRTGTALSPTTGTGKPVMHDSVDTVPPSLMDTLAPPPIDTSGSTTDMQNRLIQAAMKIGQSPAEGLSKEAKAAMLTQALESVPKQFDEAGQDIATSLLRRGGGLPAGGEFLQAYGPLAAARESTKAGLVQGVTLKDEEVRQKNKELNLQAQLQALGIASNLTGQRQQLDIAKLDVATREALAKMGIDSNEKLAAMGITSTEKLAALGITSNEKIAGMDIDSRTRLAQMGIDSDAKLAAMDTKLRTDLAQMGIDSDKALTLMNRDTQITLAEINQKGGSTGKLLAAGVISSLIQSKAGDKLIGGAIDLVGKALGIGGAAAGVGGAAAGAGAGAAGAAGAGAGAMGSTIAAFMTNPLTIGIGAAIAIGATILKSQAHWEANTAVKEFENPFGQDFLIPFHDSFFKAAEAGQLTPVQATSAIKELETAWTEYQDKINTWAQGSSDKETVARQSVANLSRTVTPALTNMRSVASQLA